MSWRCGASGCVDALISFAGRGSGGGFSLLKMASDDEQEERWVEIELRRCGGPGRDWCRVAEDSERERVTDSDRP